MDGLLILTILIVIFPWHLLLLMASMTREMQLPHPSQRKP